MRGKHSGTLRVRKWAGALAGAALLVFAAMAASRADVVDSTASGFTTRNVAVIAAAPAEVYHRLVKDVGRWWDPAHTYSKNAANLSIDDRAGGLFLEKLEGGGSVAHMTVAYAEPGQALRLLGGMGPLQALGLNGSMTWTLKPEGAGTQVELVYAVGGYRPGGLDAMAPIVDKVLADQLHRLKAYCEKR